MKTKLTIILAFVAFNLYAQYTLYVIDTNTIETFGTNTTKGDPGWLWAGKENSNFNTLSQAIGTVSNSVIQSTQGLGSAAFTLTTAYDPSGSALQATQGLGAAAFTSSSAYDPVNAALNATNTATIMRTNSSAYGLTGLPWATGLSGIPQWLVNIALTGAVTNFQSVNIVVTNALVNTTISSNGVSTVNLTNTGVASLGTVTATSFTGSGSGLTSLTAGNVVGVVFDPTNSAKNATNGLGGAAFFSSSAFQSGSFGLSNVLFTPFTTNSGTTVTGIVQNIASILTVYQPASLGLSNFTANAFDTNSGATVTGIVQNVASVLSAYQAGSFALSNYAANPFDTNSGTTVTGIVQNIASVLSAYQAGSFSLSNYLANPFDTNSGTSVTGIVQNIAGALTTWVQNNAAGIAAAGGDTNATTRYVTTNGATTAGFVATASGTSGAYTWQAPGAAAIPSGLVTNSAIAPIIVSNPASTSASLIMTNSMTTVNLTNTGTASLGTVTATSFTGTGSGLTSITAGNVVGVVFDLTNAWKSATNANLNNFGTYPTNSFQSSNGNLTAFSVYPTNSFQTSNANLTSLAGGSIPFAVMSTLTYLVTNGDASVNLATNTGNVAITNMNNLVGAAWLQPAAQRFALSIQVSLPKGATVWTNCSLLVSDDVTHVARQIDGFNATNTICPKTNWLKLPIGGPHTWILVTNGIISSNVLFLE